MAYDARPHCARVRVEYCRLAGLVRRPARTRVWQSEAARLPFEEDREKLVGSVYGERAALHLRYRLRLRRGTHCEAGAAGRDRGTRADRSGGDDEAVDEWD